MNHKLSDRLGQCSILLQALISGAAPDLSAYIGLIPDKTAMCDADAQVHLVSTVLEHCRAELDAVSEALTGGESDAGQ